MHYFFNVKDGETLLDEEGVELADLNAVKAEAVRTSAEMLKDSPGDTIWNGEAWELWVTDQPNGGGNTVLQLMFTARLPA